MNFSICPAVAAQKLRELGNCLVPLLYFGGEAAAVELDGDGVAEGNLGGVPEEVSAGVGGYGVASF